jgi:hypothetical protein
LLISWLSAVQTRMMTSLLWMAVMTLHLYFLVVLCLPFVLAERPAEVA